MAVKFHEKNQSFFIGLQTTQGGPVGTANGSTTLVVSAIGSGGTVTLSNSANLYVGAEVQITGTNSGTASGLTAGFYYIIATNNSTTMTLSATRGGVALTTGAGTFVTAVMLLNFLDSSSALAITSINADPTRTTTANVYLGDALSRDEFTVVTDTYVNISVETYQQLMVDTFNAINPNTNSIWKTFQLCGGNVALTGTTKISVGNNLDSPDYGTADRRLSSPDDDTYDKLYKYTDLRGSVDVDASVTAVPKLKFTLNGNAWPPTRAPKQVANFVNQTIRVAPVVLPTTIKTAQLAIIDDTFTNTLGAIASAAYTADGLVTITTSAAHGLTLGSIVVIKVTAGSLASAVGTFVARVLSTTTVAFFVKGLTGSGSITGMSALKGDTAVQSFCFSTLTAPNFFGFDYARYTTGCDTGFSKTAVPTDMTVGMLEDQSGGTGFDPSVYMSKFFGVYIQFGSVGGAAGSKVGYLWDKVQLANDKEGKVGSYLGRDASFRNTGSSFMLWE